jgi:hypothetical protein
LSNNTGWGIRIDNKNTNTAEDIVFQWAQTVYAGGAAGTGGGGGGATFQTNGVNNTSQSLLNLVNGTNVTITNPSGGNVNVASSGGGAGVAILAAYTQALGSGVPLPNSNTTIITKAVTMPNSGCPCRVEANWTLYLTTGNSGYDAAYVSDGTNGFAPGSTTTTGASNAYGMSAGGGSPVTYANNANVTFRLIGAGTHGGAGSTVTVNPNASPALALTGLPSSNLNLLVMSSN